MCTNTCYKKGCTFIWSRASNASKNGTTKSRSFSQAGRVSRPTWLSFRSASVPKRHWPKQPDSGSARRGGIWVDDYLQTSAADVYAVGDAIEFPHPLTGKPWLNYLANPANRQGRIVADNMVFGNTTRYEGAIGTSIAKVFDMTVASTGLAAKRLKQFGIPYASSTTHSASHAGYYPDALPLTLADLRPRERQTLRRSVRGLRRSGQAYRPDCPADQAGRHGLRSDKSRARLRPSFFIGKRPDRHSRLCGRQHHQRGDACGDLAANGGSGSLRHAVSGCAYPRGTRLRSDPRFGEHSAGRVFAAGSANCRATKRFTSIAPLVYGDTWP